MSNKAIKEQLKLAASLLELHGANPFKVRAYTGAIFLLEQQSQPLEDQDTAGLISLGFTKGIAEKITQIIHEGTFSDLEDLVQKTPKGVVEMLNIKGIGAKKIASIWKELGIESIPDLLLACQNKEIEKLKGFGAKTQQLIIEQIAFMQANANKLHYAEAEPYAIKLVEHLKSEGFTYVEATGQIRRKMEIVDLLQIVVGTEDTTKLREVLNDIPEIHALTAQSGPLVWRGTIRENNLPVEVRFTTTATYINQVFLHSASERHLSYPVLDTQCLAQIAKVESYPSEQAIYEAAQMEFVLPEMREGTFEIALAQQKQLPQLVEMQSLKGILHNHSTYSDGKHSLEEMARYCQELGYEYLGISDHSQSAFYANGLTAERVKQQHLEIDTLNEKLAPFKIFKGIESDILNDGSLDYPDEVLASFDFIVASIHSNLKMDLEKATNRLITAIENPHTTMLGHPTGRLLLRREGYPIDHQRVIDACAAHQVVIEINANPWRLDLDWRWVRYALEQGVMISINPDAHEKDGYADMRYGLLVGRKAGLTKEMTFNALSKEEVAIYFNKKKTGTLVK